MSTHIDPFWPAGARHLMTALAGLLKARQEEVTGENVLRLLEAHPTFESLSEAAECAGDEGRARLEVMRSGNADADYASFARIITAVISPLVESRSF